MNSAPRLSALGALTLVLSAAGTWFLLRIVGPTAWLFAAAPAHFVLFCDIVGLRRKYELWWAAVYAVNAGLCLATALYPWWSALLGQTVVTAVLIALEIRQPVNQISTRD